MSCKQKSHLKQHLSHYSDVLMCAENYHAHRLRIFTCRPKHSQQELFLCIHSFICIHYTVLVHSIFLIHSLYIRDSLHIRDSLYIHSTVLIFYIVRLAYATTSS